MTPAYPPAAIAQRILALVAMLSLAGAGRCVAAQPASPTGIDPPAAGASLSPEAAGPGRHAVVRIRAANRARQPISKLITGKFCEHLGRNIYRGMDAQILNNSTFADWPFRGGQTPDGIAAFYWRSGDIAGQLTRRAAADGWPQQDRKRLVQDREDGLACWWIRYGPRAAVHVSPDTGPYGGRGQRMEVSGPGQGIAQWTFLPLHRVRNYDIELLVRSPDLKSLRVSLTAEHARQPCATVEIGGLTTAWSTRHGTLRVDPQAPAGAIYRLGLTACQAGQLVVARVRLQPADHIDGADPDVVRLLRQSRLPILRWPGGNFVSGYHWQDGVGPLDQRPTRPNYAWGGVEPNQFGTDEFVAFCRNVGCEPMICVNAGSGTPEEAARWVEYCNGPANSPMGRHRAAAGHREPYRIRYWEVGNELWGRWQFYWTTAAGYVDRYHQFVKAMRAADPTIKLYACGAPAMWGKSWNDTLIEGAAPILQTITDHPLIGGRVRPTTDPMDVYRDFMAVPDVLQGKWVGLQRDMKAAGIEHPRLAVTELQMFARIAPRGSSSGPVRLTPRTLVNPATLAEALYDVLIYHRAIRLSPLVEMVTHSATVNHGGGLRKQHQRVFANPCHYGQAMLAELAGATPVEVTIDSPKEAAPRVLPDLRKATTADCAFDVIDALAAVAADGSLWISLVHAGTAGPVRVSIDIEDFPAAARAELRMLHADLPWAANTLDTPNAVVPVDSSHALRHGRLVLDVPPFTLLRAHLVP